MNFDDWVGEKRRTTFQNAATRCEAKLTTSASHLAEHARRHGLDVNNLCYVVGGSYGRREALEASDFDFIPIWNDDASAGLLTTDGANQALRKGLEDALKVDVSSGRSVNKGISLQALIDPSKIGGAQDSRDDLSRRMIVLTEASQAGGGLSLSEVRRKIVGAYAERMSGPHPLPICNDIVRYYRTLCIDYKAKQAAKEKDWAESNAKLRHSRKLWYFASMLAVAATATEHRADKPAFMDQLLERFSLPPSERLFEAAGLSSRAAVGRVLDQYAWYLQYMEDPKRRQALNKIAHEQRYEPDSPYSTLQWSAKVLHSEMMAVLDSLDSVTYGFVVDWFLF